ncbi:hypothetical protein PbB2_01643 [Candidatus Phycosocius bacilliformis]|uniref:CENP-V/GFA domain-containing protein n=1 Tax=Candidatus Phycosocius bacilliformis TaxID=1445552 RepID=A0A2P2EA94_9PROT|nr:GFA family protein [Candidatus Phycosocius bacilliformis]GBF57972.1 hypothetical protein PbB2_01643 [Candidatus Phycosocius bacilliformis]
MVKTWRTGSCHCGDVRFEVLCADTAEVEACNCSMCARTGFVHLIVPQDHFRLLAGAECLTSYRFNTGVANHTFCSRCGVKPFYTPRSNPDGISVNANCFDPGKAPDLTIVPFDGQNWEANAAKLAHKSVSPLKGKHP